MLIKYASKEERAGFVTATDMDLRPKLRIKMLLVGWSISRLGYFNAV
jgi:hypothetical protein